MTRKKVREHLFKLLFLLDFYPKTELDDQVSTYLSDIGNDADAAEETQELTQEQYEALKRALSWNGGQGYDGDGPDDDFEPVEVDY